MVISVSVFNNQLPIRTIDAASIFVDIVLFTGYIIILRSAYLLPFALLFSIFAIYGEANSYIKRIYQSEDSPSKLKQGFSSVVIFFRTLIFFVQLLPSFFHYFGKWIDEPQSFISTYVLYINQKGKLSADDIIIESDTLAKKFIRFMRFFDRAGLIGIVFLSTIPALTLFVTLAGIIGLSFAIIIFLFRGDFSFIVKDNVGSKDTPIS
jgi:hypothetical protein